ncbi:MAG: hypothetical protein LQ347_002473 [Umbilicaria vellea]|nr:MAG: hypothetical protein LQ347_002473 [Umbilicaria vellea]
MLSRGNSTASTQLRRAKSTSSVQTRQAIPPESRPIDPETARHDALTAAHVAFDRSQERAPALRKREYDSSGREIPSNTDQELSRKRSVRFTGPCAVPIRQRSITRRQAPAQTTSGRLAPQINGRSSSIRKIESFSTVVPYSGQDCIETRVFPNPSSYRRIRKSKSMYTPRIAPSIIFTNGTPSVKARHSINNDQQLPRRPDLRNSMSFVRGATDDISRNSYDVENRDAAIQMARDQYLRQLEDQRLKERPSFLHPGKRRKSQKAFRRTVRTSSTNSYGSAISSSDHYAGQGTKSQGLGRKARDLSFSLKDKLKRVFRKSSQLEEGIPSQQLDATRAHFRDYLPATSGVDQGYKPVSPSNGSVLRRINSRSSSLLSVMPQDGKDYREGSIRSVRSDDSITNGRSRVTSWTNSTVANTVNTRDILMDKKRLSIIQENGGQHHSPKRVHLDGIASDGRYAVFRKPLGSGGSGVRSTGPVNSQRVYSALMRKLEQKLPAAKKVEVDNLIGTGYCEPSHRPSTTPTRSSTADRKRTPGISRALSHPSEESLPSVQSVEVSRSILLDHSSKALQDHVNTRDSERASETLKNPPHDLTERTERKYPQRRGPLREIRSPFFPPSTRIESLKISPYRRAVQGSSEERSGTEDETYEAFGRSHGIDQQPNISRQLFRRGSTIGSDSVYSQTQDGNTPRPTDSYVTLTGSECAGEPGTAVIITNRKGDSNAPTVPAVRTRNTSAKSSNEWKTWMASEVASLENESQGNGSCYDDWILKENGHQREYSQINGDDVQVGIQRSYNPLPKQPLAIIHGNLANRAPLRCKRSDQMLDRFPVLNVGSPPDSSIPNRALSKPGSLPRSLSNIENERFPPTHGHREPSFVCSKSSHTSLLSQNSYTPPIRAQLYANATARDRLHAESSSTLHSRQSPERAARLRRMQSAATGLKELVDRQFGSVQSQQRQHWPENQAINSGSTATLEREGLYEMYEAGSNSPLSTESPGRANRGMVDAFLNRKRAVMGTSKDGDRAGPVFL